MPLVGIMPLAQARPSMHRTHPEMMTAWAVIVISFVYEKRGHRAGPLHPTFPRREFRVARPHDDNHRRRPWHIYPLPESTDTRRYWPFRALVTLRVLFTTALPPFGFHHLRDTTRKGRRYPIRVSARIPRLASSSSTIFSQGSTK